MKRTRISLNGAWQYSVSGKDMGLIKVPYSRLCVGESTCRLLFDADITAHRSFLCFEGITYKAKVTLNGRVLGEMFPYSFYSFEVTDILKQNSNDLVVDIKDMNLPFGPSEGWENYGGIIRDVYLLNTDKIKIDDVVWRTEVSERYESAKCEVSVELSGGDEKVKVSLADRNGFTVASGECDSTGGKATVTLTLERPNMWSTDMPYLYELAVAAGDDETREKVGVKDFRINGQRFVLNGKPMYLKGVCRHDMWGDQGHTLTDAQMEKDMRMIKATGCNFVRLVHYPHNRRIVELADEIGLLVSEEPGLWWSDMHNPDTIAGALAVMERIVRRDRNRVSIAFWLCFNECIFTPEFLRDSSKICKTLDPTRPVSGANCMNIEMTKDMFVKNGFDFYTMHPYGLELNHVGGGVDGSISLDKILDTLNDKPLIFTEWGGLYVFENPKLFARFQSYMLNAWKNPDGGRVLAGSCYWVWADMYEFGRGEHACFNGILNEGLVDIYRNARVNLDVFAKLLNGMEFERDCQKAQAVSPFTVKNPEALRPIDVWSGKDKSAQAELYQKLLTDSTPQQGYYHKKNRRFTYGPALPEDYAFMGNLPVALKAGQPLIVGDGLEIPINMKVSQVYFIGNVSLPYGFPAYGERGEAAAEYVFEYADGTSETITLRNGIELTTALGSVGPSRIKPIAENVETAISYSYDLNWEHYVVNLFEARCKASVTLVSIRARVLDAKYAPLIYGITVRGAMAEE